MSQTPVTGLYVPGDRPDRFEKAVRSGAELVVFDLEDAVAPSQKPVARMETTTWLKAHAGENGPVLQIRVNRDSEDDLDALSDVPETVELRVPKVERVADIDRVHDRVGPRALTALIESAAGVLSVERIATHNAVTRIALGEADLAAQLGSGRPVVNHARMALVFAAAAAGIEPPMLSVFPVIDDLDALAADTRVGASIGFGGRMAVHPKQLATIEAAFRPSTSDVAWARQVLEATAAGGVHRLADGEMVDAAMRSRARRVLARDARLSA